MGCPEMSAWPIDCPETSATNYQSTLCNIPEDKDIIYTAAEARNHAVC
jgi:hypothetical protein